MASTASNSFAPKDPPKLDPPKDDPITLADLAMCDGTITLSCRLPYIWHHPKVLKAKKVLLIWL